LQEKVDKHPVAAEEMMIAEDLMEDQEAVQVAAATAAAPVVAVQVAVAAVHQMDEAPQVAQMEDLLHAVQKVDAVVLHQVEAILQAREENLQAMEDVAAEKVVLLQADEIEIETIKKNRASALFFYS
jgi:hypothetical protein